MAVTSPVEPVLAWTRQLPEGKWIPIRLAAHVLYSSHARQAVGRGTPPAAGSLQNGLVVQVHVLPGDCPRCEPCITPQRLPVWPQHPRKWRLLGQHLTSRFTRAPPGKQQFSPSTPRLPQAGTP